MDDTYLIQRLSSRPRSELEAKATQVFGGGPLLLQPDAWKLVQGIFDIEYMGASEYEWGALPKSWREFASDHKDLVTFEMVLHREEIKRNEEWKWHSRDARRKEIDEAKAKGKRPPRRPKGWVAGDPPMGPVTIYILCRKAHREGVEQRIRDLAMDKIHTKMSNNFARALDPVGTDVYYRRTCGWYELDNGWFAFTDKEMWEKTTALFCGQST